MVKSAKRGKKKSATTTTTSTLLTSSSVPPLNNNNATAGTTAAATATAPNQYQHHQHHYNNKRGGGGGDFGSNSNNTTTITTNSYNNFENLDDLHWLRECEVRHNVNGDPYLQLEYQDDDELILLLHRFLEESAATKDIIDKIYQIWQQTVIGTLLQSSTVWKKDVVNAVDQRQMKETLKTARYKINFLLHHVTGRLLTHHHPKWMNLRPAVLDMCYQTLLLVPRLAESCPHSPHDIRLAIIHFEGKEFLAAVACETWDTLYDFCVPIDFDRFVPVLRRCAMLDILDKDWNMLGGWEDILKGLETKCSSMGGGSIGGVGSDHDTNGGGGGGGGGCIPRLPSDAILHETTTILRNARNSMQCKFFSVRFMRYSEDQAPQRWRYFRKCSAPACANIETREYPHAHRCEKCWYFHYCSPACMEYCDHIMGLHPKFCLDTPAGKAALCRKETEVYLGWASTVPSHPSSSSSSSTHANQNGTGDPTTAAGAMAAHPPVPLACAACGAVDIFSSSSSSSKQLKRCQQCRSISYCSRQCQEWDWRVGGHRAICVPAAGGTTPSGATAASTPLNGSSSTTAVNTATTATNTSSGTTALSDLN